jgi:hypothetical protein
MVSPAPAAPPCPQNDDNHQQQRQHGGLHAVVAEVAEEAAAGADTVMVLVIIDPAAAGVQGGEVRQEDRIVAAKQPAGVNSDGSAIIRTRPALVARSSRPARCRRTTAATRAGHRVSAFENHTFDAIEIATVAGQFAWWRSSLPPDDIDAQAAVQRGDASRTGSACCRPRPTEAWQGRRRPAARFAVRGSAALRLGDEEHAALPRVRGRPRQCDRLPAELAQQPGRLREALGFLGVDRERGHALAGLGTPAQGVGHSGEVDAEEQYDQKPGPPAAMKISIV